MHSFIVWPRTHRERPPHTLDDWFVKYDHEYCSAIIKNQIAYYRKKEAEIAELERFLTERRAEQEERKRALKLKLVSEIETLEQEKEGNDAKKPTVEASAKASAEASESLASLGVAKTQIGRVRELVDTPEFRHHGKIQCTTLCKEAIAEVQALGLIYGVVKPKYSTAKPEPMIFKDHFVVTACGLAGGDFIVTTIGNVDAIVHHNPLRRERDH